MRTLCFSLVIVVLLLNSSCQKKDNVTVTPVVGQPKAMADPAKSPTDTVKNGVLAYPYTDTFTGTLSVSFLYNSYVDLDTSHSSYRFYVTHLSATVMVFNCSETERIMNSWLYWLTDKPDTGTLDINNSYSGKLFVCNTYKVRDTYDQGLPAVYTLQNNGSTLTVSWDNQYFPVPGTCDWGDSKGLYNGTRK